MNAELEKIDRYLEDETLYRLIRDDLSKRWPKTEETGRHSTPVEVVLRMLVVKRLYGYSYEETVERVRDSLSLRQFCRVYLNKVPVDTTLLRSANVIQPKTLEKFNERIMQLAVERKVTNGRKLRTDGTVVESNLHAPSDNRLLADGVRVLARTVVRARVLLEQNVQEPFEDFTQAARQRARQIGETLRKKIEAYWIWLIMDITVIMTGRIIILSAAVASSATIVVIIGRWIVTNKATTAPLIHYHMPGGVRIP
ncbi:MAG TPA: transposase [Anaerolineales bacterium]|nr:transposase [Anaerolineales bacterium]